VLLQSRLRDEPLPAGGDRRHSLHSQQAIFANQAAYYLLPARSEAAAGLHHHQQLRRVRPEIPLALRGDSDRFHLEVLDNIPALPLPTYEGLRLSVHDSCSFRKKPQVHAAVRSLLDKMNIEVVESEFSGTKSICCGDNFYPRLSVEEVNAFQKKRASQMPCQDVAVYCVSCIKSMQIGGKTPHHMMDLVLGLPTEPGETRLDVYHKELDDYIEEH
jgi:hypothetical protein